MAFSSRFRSILLVSAFATSTWSLDRVDIVALPADIATLEANPYGSDKIPALWITNGDSLHAGVSYRGAYSLMGQLEIPDGPRNWKVKTVSATPWRGYREWNFNVQPHVREKLARDLYAAASVPVQQSHHVELYVNSKRSGVYLAFPDPDNKPWVREHWGSAAGDLFKAATDLPNDTAWFGELTDLGDTDSAYYLHYQKKLNNDSLDSLDYSRLRRFIVWINRSSDQEFQQGLRARFDLDAFLRYLVVSNFIGHWDGYPNRGKNYWLYQDPADSAWSFIPWDVDANFQSAVSCLNNMGVNAGLFFMTWPRTYCGNKKETQKRPLFERIFAVEEWKLLYLGEYQRAMSTYLEKGALDRRVDSLGALLQGRTQGDETLDFQAAQTDIRNYLTKRTAAVKTLLAAYPAYEGTTATKRREAPLPKITQGDWMDLQGRRIPSDRLRSAPPGVYRRGSQTRVIF